MTNCARSLLCLVASICITVAAQSDEPLLIAVNLPKYPPLARQARVQGVVKLTFTLSANSAEPTNIEVVSGHPMLKAAAMDNLKTWSFENHYAIQRRYETTFSYRLSAVDVPAPTRERITFDSFHEVVVLTDPVQTMY
jgi:TonB family protein